MPAAQSPEDDAALIGGIIGGAITLVLIGALIAFCVARSRRKQPKDNNASVLYSATTAPPESNYGRIAPTQSNYTETVSIAQSGNSHYDSLNANEL